MNSRKSRHIIYLRLPLKGLALTIGCVSAAVLAGVMLIQGCGSRPEGSAGIPVADSGTMPDTLVHDTVPEEEPRLVFGSQVEMLDYMANSPHAARYRMGILPDMVATAPEYVEELLNNRHPRFLVADKGSMRVIVYDSLGVEIRSFRMAAGKGYGTKHKRRDCRTPEGLFSVEGIYDSTDWLYTDDDGNTSPVKGQFGPRFIRLRIPTTSQIGIHGTCAPWSIGGRRSHGCMRLTNDDIMELVAMVEKGMPVIVNPSRRDSRVNEEEGVVIPRIRTGHLDPTSGKETVHNVAVDTVRTSGDSGVIPDTIQNVNGSDTTEVRLEAVPDTEPDRHGNEPGSRVGEEPESGKAG